MNVDTILTTIDNNTNNIFKTFCFKDSYEFVTSGITDKLINLIYVRPLVTGPTKYIFKKQDLETLVKCKYRLVVQTKKGLTNVAPTIINILSGIKELSLISYTDDTDGVYKAEYGEIEVLRSFNLYAFDFDFETDMTYGCEICECINNELCGN